MKAGPRLPMFVVAAALLGLMTLLASLQYRWLGRISDAERERMTASLGAHSAAFAQEFDKELTRAYATFQLEPAPEEEPLAGRVAARYDRWLATARHPRLVKDVYLAPAGEGNLRLQRFDPARRAIEPVEWPAALATIRDEMARPAQPKPPDGVVVVRTMPSVVLEDVPALVVPVPMLLLAEHLGPKAPVHRSVRFTSALSFVVLVLDRGYIIGEMLPAMVQQHFQSGASDTDYEVAVVSLARDDVLFRSTGGFSPRPSAKVDAAAEFFRVRLEEFGAITAEVRRFAALFSTGGERRTNTAVSIVMPPGEGAAPSPTRGGGTPRWKVMVKHPAGSLEAAVNAARRRNLAISFSVLALLGVSMVFLVVSTRRAQDLARQQMEFVATVSHELRTPLAVIRSAGDNLADGVVHSEEQIRKYGDLVRTEGRRLTEMVEQILEFAGIQSGQRTLVMHPVAVAPLVSEVVESSRAILEAAGVRIECAFADPLPPVVADEQALRRVLQNLVGNALKYGRSGGWIGVRAHAAGSNVQITVADRGIGIGVAEQARIFEPFYRAPDVVAAQIQGAGLGLSLVKRIVEAHGGHVTVRSAPGQGSEFTIHVPAATEEPLLRTSERRAGQNAEAPGRG